VGRDADVPDPAQVADHRPVSSAGRDRSCSGRTSRLPCGRAPSCGCRIVWARSRCVRSGSGAHLSRHAMWRANGTTSRPFQPQSRQIRTAAATTCNRGWAWCILVGCNTRPRSSVAELDMWIRTALVAAVALGLVLPAGITCGLGVSCSPAVGESGCCCGPTTAAHPCCEESDEPTMDPGCGCAPAEPAAVVAAPARTDDAGRSVSPATRSSNGSVLASGGPDVPRARELPTGGSGPPPQLASCVLRL